MANDQQIQVLGEKHRQLAAHILQVVKVDEKRAKKMEEELTDMKNLLLRWALEEKQQTTNTHV